MAMNSTYDWLMADSLEVAPRLLGWELVTGAGSADETAGRIVEVEAYHGSADAASHAYRGITPRTAPMFEAGGRVYVYLSYGIHTCMNVTTGPAGEGQAVLIRALEPTVGLKVMTSRRGQTNPRLLTGGQLDARLLTSGPGRLTQALGVTLADSGQRLGEHISLRPPAQPVPAADIVPGPRVGISNAKNLPWRFYVKGNQFVSKS
jgi:DNA-3-methyladenine glycosylase